MPNIGIIYFLCHTKGQRKVKIPVCDFSMAAYSVYQYSIKILPASSPVLTFQQVHNESKVCVFGDFIANI